MGLRDTCSWAGNIHAETVKSRWEWSERNKRWGRKEKMGRKLWGDLNEWIGRLDTRACLFLLKQRNRTSDEAVHPFSFLRELSRESRTPHISQPFIAKKVKQSAAVQKVVFNGKVCVFEAKLEKSSTFFHLPPLFYSIATFIFPLLWREIDFYLTLTAQVSAQRVRRENQQTWGTRIHHQTRDFCSSHPHPQTHT